MKNNLPMITPDLIHHDLKKHRKLWIDTYHTLDGLLFDGIPGFIAPTIFYLVGRAKRNPELMQLAAKWQPDLIAWLSDEEKLELMDRNEDILDLTENEVLMIVWGE